MRSKQLFCTLVMMINSNYKILVHFRKQIWRSLISRRCGSQWHDFYNDIVSYDADLLQKNEPSSMSRWWHFTTLLTLFVVSRQWNGYNERLQIQQDSNLGPLGLKSRVLGHSNASVYLWTDTWMWANFNKGRPQWSVEMHSNLGLCDLKIQAETKACVGGWPNF